MLFDELLKAIVDTLNPLKIIGNIKNAIDPALGFIDSQLGYDNYQLCYAGRPDLATLATNVFYLYVDDNDQLVCLIKRKDPKTKEESTDEIALPKEYLGEHEFNKIVETIHKHDSSIGLDFDTRAIIYNFLSSNQVKSGYRHSFHSNVAAPYNKFETNFIRKHPIIYKTYQFAKRVVNNLCTFATSQTGARIAGLASFIAMSTLSGGVVPAVMVGAYAASIGVALMQQAYYRKRLNNLTEETQLIVRYLENKKKLGNTLCFQKTPLPEQDKSWIGAIKRVTSSVTKHLSAYILEAAVPVAAAILSPVNGAITAIQFGVAVGLASVGVGIGAYFRKTYDDQRLELQSAIARAKQDPAIPNYKNIAELKQEIMQQEKALTTYKENDPTLKNRSGLRQYLRGLVEVIDPFHDAQSIENPKIFSNTVQRIALGITATATLATGVPDLTIAAMPAASIGITAIAASATAKMHASVQKAKKLHFTIKPKDEQQVEISRAHIQKLAPPQQQSQKQQSQEQQTQEQQSQVKRLEQRRKNQEHRSRSR